MSTTQSTKEVILQLIQDANKKGQADALFNKFKPLGIKDREDLVNALDNPTPEQKAFFDQVMITDDLDLVIEDKKITYDKVATEILFDDIAMPLCEMGYRPVPIIRGDKRPAIKDWVNYTYTTGQSFKNSYTGILLGQGVVAIDVDVYDPNVAQVIEEYINEEYPGGLRRVGQPPKSAYLFKAPSGTVKQKTRIYNSHASDKESAVELLGQGQQIVAYGIHPDTHQPYYWTDDDPLSIKASDLTEISQEQITEILDYADKVLHSYLGEPKGHAKQDLKPAGPTNMLTSVHGQDGKIEKLLAATKKIPNGDCHYDDWVRIGMALKGGTSHNPELGFQAFDEWSQSSGKYDYDFTRKTWDSFNPQTIGAGTVIAMANQYGYQGEREEVATSSPPIKANDLDLFIVSNLARGTPKPTDWVVENVLQRGIVSMMCSLGGVGKSFLLLDLAAKVGGYRRASDDHADQWMGNSTRAARGAVMITAEDDQNVIHHRIHNAFPNMAYEETGDRVAIITVPDLGRDEFHFFDENARPTEFFDSILTYTLNRGADLLIIDPLRMFSRADTDKSTQDGAKIMGYLNNIAKLNGIHIIISHHLNKLGVNAKSAQEVREAISGTSALVDHARCVMAIWNHPDQVAAFDLLQQVETGNFVQEEALTKVYQGGIVKSNGFADMTPKTFVRCKSGLLLDKTHEVIEQVKEEDNSDITEAEKLAMITHVRLAFERGKPYTDAETKRGIEHKLAIKAYSDRLAAVTTPSKYRKILDKLMDEKRVIVTQRGNSVTYRLATDLKLV